ncbi:MAG: TPM domain-containing protein [Lachnospiraceae bacterium]|nr:TPM domain-containing protein [Lachnospiraceae bacterium]
MAKKKKKQAQKPKKQNTNSFIKKLKKAPAFVWVLAAIAAVVVMFAPVAVDFVNEITATANDQNSGTGKIYVEDGANLLTDQERQALVAHMQPITQYGSVAFVTINKNSTSADRYAEKRYKELIGLTSGTLFLIDMDNRQIFIYSGGRIYSTVTRSKADTITDNVYRLASKKKYYDCAAKVFDQIGTILAGGMIPEPMKHLCNALLSMAFALILVFMIANFRTRIRKSGESNVFDETAEKKFEIGEPKAMIVLSEKKTRHVESSGGGGGHGFSGGGGGFSGGGGGGGFSGGGGGHGF